MKIIDYQTGVRRTARIDDKEQKTLSAETYYGLNFSLKLGGEAGEVQEIIGKHVFHGKPLDLIALKKELGDVLWYVTALGMNYGIDLADVMQTNLEKLKARYPDGFKRQDEEPKP